MSPPRENDRLLRGASAPHAWDATPLRGATRQALLDLSAIAAVAAMRDGELKAEHYAAALLEQADRIKSLNAFRTLQPERVMEAAREADKRRAAGKSLGALHGLPVPVKDSVDTQALPTSYGTGALGDFRPGDDAAALKPLWAEGAILMGKTNLHELSCGWTSNNVAFGPVLNPYDPTRTPGGSSGGSAAVVAAHAAPLAIGGDTYGSIRLPASFCGLAGLRPTFGRYPNAGIMPISLDKFDQVGPLARTVSDLALFDSVVTGLHDRVQAAPLSGVRIAVDGEPLSGSMDPEVSRIIEEAIRKLGDAGAEIVRMPLPPLARQASDVVIGILIFEVVRSFTDYLKHDHIGVSFDQLVDQASPSVAGLLNAGRNAGSPAAYQELLLKLGEIKAAILAFYRDNQIDAIALTPAAIAAFPQGDPEAVLLNGKPVSLFTAIGCNVAPGSCAGLSCLVVPAGMTAIGLPVGLELDGPPGSDRRLLALGLSVEEVLGPLPPARIGRS